MSQEEIDSDIFKSPDDESDNRGDNETKKYAKLENELNKLDEDKMKSPDYQLPLFSDDNDSDSIKSGEHVIGTETNLYDNNDKNNYLVRENQVINNIIVSDDEDSNDELNEQENETVQDVNDNIDPADKQNNDKNEQQNNKNNITNVKMNNKSNEKQRKRSLPNSIDDNNEIIAALYPEEFENTKSRSPCSTTSKKIVPAKRFESFIERQEASAQRKREHETSKPEEPPYKPEDQPLDSRKISISIGYQPSDFPKPLHVEDHQEDLSEIPPVYQRIYTKSVEPKPISVIEEAPQETKPSITEKTKNIAINRNSKLIYGIIGPYDILTLTQFNIIMRRIEIKEPAVIDQIREYCGTGDLYNANLLSSLLISAANNEPNAPRLAHKIKQTVVAALTNVKLTTVSTPKKLIPPKSRSTSRGSSRKSIKNSELSNKEPIESSKLNPHKEETLNTYNENPKPKSARRTAKPARNNKYLPSFYDRIDINKQEENNKRFMVSSLSNPRNPKPTVWHGQ